MINLVRRLAVGGGLITAAVALAGPASAAPLDGSYTATITAINPPSEFYPVGSTMQLQLTSCGPDCMNLLTDAAIPWTGQLHPQGSTWTGSIQTAKRGSTCMATLNDSASTLVFDCPDIPGTMHYALAKNG